MNKLWVSLASILGIVVLEGMNIIFLKHNGTMLMLAVCAIAGIGGWKLRDLRDEEPKDTIKLPLP